MCDLVGGILCWLLENGRDFIILDHIWTVVFVVVCVLVKRGGFSRIGGSLALGNVIKVASQTLVQKFAGSMLSVHLL